MLPWPKPGARFFGATPLMLSGCGVDWPLLLGPAEGVDVGSWCCAIRKTTGSINEPLIKPVKTMKFHASPVFAFRSTNLVYSMFAHCLQQVL